MFSRFLAECPVLLDNTPRARAETRIRLDILRSALGERRDLRTLTENDVRQYEARRRAGGIVYGERKITAAVRQRTIQADVRLLKQVLRWACTVIDADGAPLLERDPLVGVRVRGEHDILRPVASYDRFEATRAAMRQLQRRYANEAKVAESPRERGRAESRERSWIRAEFGLVLLEATGKRRGAIMGLQWQDLDFTCHQIAWRSAYDKTRKTWVVTYPSSLFETVREFQTRLGALGGYVFPRRGDPERAAPRELLSHWIAKAEREAGLPKLRGGLCHPYRRKWRSERSQHPIKAVANAGGWSDVTTMLRCYDQPDDADILAVTSEPRKRRETLVVASG
jgi:integrase